MKPLETCECVLRRLIKDGMFKFDRNIYFIESRNAIDDEFYTLSEIKELFKKLLKEI